MTSSPSPSRKKYSASASGMQIPISTSLLYWRIRRPITGSPIGSRPIVFVSRWTCVSGTHSSISIGSNSPTSLTRHGLQRW